MNIDPTWHDIGGGVCLIVDGGDPQRIEDRYAVIEKTPRIRIRSFGIGSTEGRGYRDAPAIENDWIDNDWKNWAPGPKGSGPGDERSRAWCIEALRVFGHEVQPAAPPEPKPVKFMVFKYNNGPSVGAVVRLSPDEHGDLCDDCWGQRTREVPVERVMSTEALPGIHVRTLGSPLPPGHRRAP